MFAHQYVAVFDYLQTLIKRIIIGGVEMHWKLNSTNCLVPKKGKFKFDRYDTSAESNRK